MKSKFISYHSGLCKECLKPDGGGKFALTQAMKVIDKSGPSQRFKTANGSFVCSWPTKVTDLCYYHTKVKEGEMSKPFGLGTGQRKK